MPSPRPIAPSRSVLVTFTLTRSGAALEQLRDALAHRLEVRREARHLRDDRGVEIADREPALRAPAPARAPTQLRARDARERRIRRREVACRGRPRRARRAARSSPRAAARRRPSGPRARGRAGSRRRRARAAAPPPARGCRSPARPASLTRASSERALGRARDPPGAVILRLSGIALARPARARRAPRRARRSRCPCGPRRRPWRAPRAASRARKTCGVCAAKQLVARRRLDDAPAAHALDRVARRAPRGARRRARAPPRPRAPRPRPHQRARGVVHRDQLEVVAAARRGRRATESWRVAPPATGAAQLRVARQRAEPRRELARSSAAGTTGTTRSIAATRGERLEGVGEQRSARQRDEGLRLAARRAARRAPRRRPERRRAWRQHSRARPLGSAVALAGRRASARRW